MPPSTILIAQQQGVSTMAGSH